MTEVQTLHERIAALSLALADTVKCMRLWADEEDGMPEAFFRQYVKACQLIDSRYCRVIRRGIQSCGDCMALSCGDNTNAEAKAALAEKGVKKRRQKPDADVLAHDETPDDLEVQDNE